TAGSSVCGHDDRDFARRLPCRYSGGREPSDDDIDFEADQLGGQFGKPVEASIRRSKLKSNVLPLHIPQIVQPLPKHPPKLLRVYIANDQCATGRHLRLLRGRRERPRERRAAEQRYELAALHSITSSAATCSVSGTVKPRALADFRLITSSNLVGCCTGRSAGFSPLRTRPAETPSR